MNNLNTDFLFFKEIHNIEVLTDYDIKPPLKDGFSITDNSNNDMYIIYLTTTDKIGLRDLKDNTTNNYIDSIVLMLSFLLSNKEYLTFKEIKHIFNTYLMKYVYKDCKFTDLYTYIRDGKY